jgi:uncharacterized membrane protein
MGNDPRTFWLVVTNVLLGLIALVAVLGVVTGVLCELWTRRRRRRAMMNEIERDARNLFSNPRYR